MTGGETGHEQGTLQSRTHAVSAVDPAGDSKDGLHALQMFLFTSHSEHPGPLLNK